MPGMLRSSPTAKAARKIGTWAMKEDSRGVVGSAGSKALVANFGGLVLDRIEADLCKQVYVIILRHFSRYKKTFGLLHRSKLMFFLLSRRSVVDQHLSKFEKDDFIKHWRTVCTLGKPFAKFDCQKQPFNSRLYPKPSARSPGRGGRPPRGSARASRRRRSPRRRGGAAPRGAPRRREPNFF